MKLKVRYLADDGTKKFFPLTDNFKAVGFRKDPVLREIDFVERTNLPGAVKIGEPRTKSFNLTITVYILSDSSESDGNYRSKLNTLYSAFDTMDYLYDDDNNIRAKCELVSMADNPDDAITSVLRSGTAEITLKQLEPFWEDQNENTSYGTGTSFQFQIQNVGTSNTRGVLEVLCDAATSEFLAYMDATKEGIKIQDNVFGTGDPLFNYYRIDNINGTSQIGNSLQATDVSNILPSVGETGPGGGTVFLVSNDNVYEVSSTIITGKVSGIIGEIPGANGTAIGDGINNTNVIKDFYTGLDSIVNKIPKEEGGYSDWFIPSNTTLSYIFNVLNPPDGFYWSSTQENSSIVIPGSNNAVFDTGDNYVFSNGNNKVYNSGQSGYGFIAYETLTGEEVVFANTQNLSAFYVRVTKASDYVKFRLDNQTADYNLQMRNQNIAQNTGFFKVDRGADQKMNVEATTSVLALFRWRNRYFA